MTIREFFETEYFISTYSKIRITVWENVTSNSNGNVAEVYFIGSNIGQPEDSYPLLNPGTDFPVKYHCNLKYYCDRHYITPFCVVNLDPDKPIPESFPMQSVLDLKVDFSFPISKDSWPLYNVKEEGWYEINAFTPDLWENLDYEPPMGFLEKLIDVVSEYYDSP